MEKNRFLLQKQVDAVKNFCQFMELEDSLQCSNERARGPCSKPYLSVQILISYLFNANYNIIFPFTRTLSKILT
jgi:hypothetical protein